MQIVRLGIKDADKLVQMVEMFKDESLNIEISQRFLENTHNYFIACIIENTIVGFVLGYQMQRYDGCADMVYIHEVNVLEQYRRRGIGKKMIESFIDICKGKGLSKIFLITLKSNIPAVCLYDSTGGVSIYDDDIVFSYEL